MTNKEAKEILEWELNNFKYTDNEFVEATKVAIKALEERPKGKWIAIHKGYVCSNCNKYTITINDKHYCFKCGAVMRGDV